METHLVHIVVAVNLQHIIYYPTSFMHSQSLDTFSLIEQGRLSVFHFHDEAVEKVHLLSWLAMCVRSFPLPPSLLKQLAVLSLVFAQICTHTTGYQPTAWNWILWLQANFLADSPRDGVDLMRDPVPEPPS